MKQQKGQSQMSSCRKTSFSFQEIILLSLLDALKRLMLTQWQQATPSHNVEQPACLVWFGLVELIVPEGQFVAQAAVKHKEIQAVRASDTHGSHMIQVFSKPTARDKRVFESFSRAIWGRSEGSNLARYSGGDRD